ncbi:MAG: type I-E CRISPR-associated protein Cse2/CasB [Gammaproteobacteria bacterium]|nr:type I-E CRISPR-associated protein Cse2/CasB [Gammaproteobacteria bacterium]
MKIEFSAESELGKAVQAWWLSLESDNGGRAELRRAKTLTTVIVSPCFQRLYGQVRPLLSSDRGDWPSRLAMIAVVLAHVKQADNTEIAMQLASPKAGGSKARLSNLRFRRLLQRSRDDVWLALVRVLPMLDRKANVFDLANSLFYWGDKVKQRWAYAYFAKASVK